ncbi:hypothetical protein AMJ80_00510 [bacterium SM23_31]|nr:MAG: hypothetical protein AMJ80_00510 [bacterium SM23_31]
MIKSFERIAAISKKELRQLRRDKRTLSLLLFFPAFMLVLFGYALNFDVKNISLAILDQDRTEHSRKLAVTFQQYDYFIAHYYLESGKEIDSYLDRGKAAACMVIPKGFEKNIIEGIETPVQFIIDGTNANTAQTILGYIDAIINAYQQKIIVSRMQRTGSTLSIPVSIEQRIMFNQDLKTVRFLLPGLIAFILMIVGVVSTSLSVVREKELGTIEQIKVSPTSAFEWIIGKSITYFIVSLIASTLVLVMGWYLFDITVKGSIFELYIAISLFLMGALGMGLFISTIAETQQVAFIIALLSSILPTMILSGFVFPIKSMPFAIQLVTYIVPARYFLTIIRGIVLKGTSMSLYLDQMAYLGIFAFVVFLISTIKMHKREI